MATQQVNAAKLKSTGVNLTNLAAKIKKITQLCARSLQQKGE